jgi:hypothetical protein
MVAQASAAPVPGMMEKSLFDMKLLTNIIMALHYTIGIRTPPPEEMRKVAIVWVVSAVCILATLVVLLVWVL